MTDKSVKKTHSRNPHENRRRASSGKSSYGLRSVGQFLPAITRPVFEKFGFQRAALLTDWDVIVGEPLCHFTAPEQIKWQKQNNDKAEVEQHGAKSGAVLVIRVDGPAALEVQHSAPQIIERINSYFGYKAVASVRILQAPVKKDAFLKPKTRINLDKPLPQEPQLDVADDRLETALRRLWRGIQSHKVNQQQKK